jgi:uncharacterized protein DUF3309
MIALLSILLLLMLLGLPTWPYSERWTYYPSATIGFICFSLAALAFSGRL